MNNSYFVFDNKRYYEGTIVTIKQHKRELFRYNSTVKFVCYNSDKNLYYFSSLSNILDCHGVAKDQIVDCIEKVEISRTMPINTPKKMDPKYIDCIVNAWCWYILIMFFAFFLKGMENKIITWLFSTFIFFNWRNRKINGG